MFKTIANWLRQPKAQTSDSLREVELPVFLGNSETIDSQLVPYDENLLERSRTQWQFGDWTSLAKLQKETLQHHPDRAKLALLAAAGHQQLANLQAARRLVRLAQDWGVSRKLISQILCAGVHNTLGRAAAIGCYEQRALHHFESAIVIGTPGSESRLISRARIDEQLRQLNLATKGYSSINCATDAKIPVVPPLSVDQCIDSTRPSKEQRLEPEPNSTKQADELIRMREFFVSAVKKEVGNATKQMEAFFGLQNYFASGELPDINPQSHGWPISPDLALYLIELIELKNYGLYIEFGSGTSTVVAAKALAKMAKRSQNQSPAKLISFDHLREFYQQTQDHLNQVGLAETVELHFAPLKDYAAPNGKTYPFYDCEGILTDAARRHLVADLRILVIVDGPPGKTGPHARYPALPIVLNLFKGARIDFLMDDYSRDEEKQILKLWQQELKSMGHDFTTQSIDLEKGACLISTYMKPISINPDNVPK